MTRSCRLTVQDRCCVFAKGAMNIGRRHRNNQARIWAATVVMGAVEDLRLLGCEGHAVGRFGEVARHLAIFQAKK